MFTLTLIMSCLAFVLLMVVLFYPSTLLTLFLAVGLLLLGGYAAASEMSASARVRVGDAVVVAGTPLRFSGADAPEPGTQAGE